MVFNNILFKDRVTKPQKKMLITLLRETKYMEGKKEKEWYWEKIQAALNTIGPKKTIIQWKKCWRDMRLTTRKKLAELKRCQLAGGSPPPGIELNQEDNDIIDIVGHEYFYEEMNGELKPESFMSGFDYVPENFCDAILTAAAVSSGQQQHMQHVKAQEQQHAAQQQQQQQHASQQQDHHTNDGETSDAPGSSNHTDTHGNAFQPQNVAQMAAQHNGEHAQANGTGGPGTSHQHNNNMPQHPAFHGGLHPHLLRRQQHAAVALQRETVFEEKLLQLMQEAFPKKSKKRKQRDPDKLFLLSLFEEMKRVPEEIRLDVKTELIQVLKKYQKKAPVKQEKSSSNSSHSHSQASSTATSSKQSSSSDKIQLPQHAQLSHSMYQLQKKYEKSDKEDSQHSHDASNPAVSVVPLHPAQLTPHSLFQLQKKYEDSAEKVHDQRKHVEAAHQQHQQQQQQQQQQQAHQQPPPPSANEQHLHHSQIPHSIMFPLPQIRNEQPAGQHHNPHNPHAHQHQQQQQPQQQHHPPTIFGAPTSAAPMSADRPAMAYENVG